MIGCVHWWVLAAPRDNPNEQTPARCKHCGAERTFAPEAPAQPTRFVWGFGARDPFKNEDAA